MTNFIEEQQREAVVNRNSIEFLVKHGNSEDEVIKALTAQTITNTLNHILESGLLEEKDISAFDNDPIHPVRANYTGHNTLARAVRTLLDSMKV